MTSEIIERGTLVESLAGHDKGETFAIINTVDGNYVLIANGKTRGVQAPKRKKIKHIKLLNTKIDLEAMEQSGGITDGGVRRAIKENLKKIGG